MLCVNDQVYSRCTHSGGHVIHGSVYHLLNNKGADQPVLDWVVFFMFTHFHKLLHFILLKHTAETLFNKNLLGGSENSDLKIQQINLQFVVITNNPSMHKKLYLARNRCYILKENHRRG